MLRALCVSLLFVSPLVAQESGKPATVVPVQKNGPKDKWWQDRHQKFVEQSKAGNIDVAFIGDSITQGWEGAGKEAWAKHFAPLKAGNYGIGGDQTQHVLWRITEGKELEGITPKVAVLMIGTNNTGSHSPKDIALGIEEIVKELRKQKPEIKVLLLGVFPRSAKWGIKEDKVEAKDLHRKIGEINKIISGQHDGKNVFYLDISQSFLEKDGSMTKEIMPDFLHLSPKGYEFWAEAIEGKVKELLK
jgi:lysophospholipase L1-like esterase